MEGSINLITATGSVPLENYLTTVVGNVGSKIASAQFADDVQYVLTNTTLEYSRSEGLQFETLPPETRSGS